MLSERYLSYDEGADGRVHPRWLGPRDDAWLREIVLACGALPGCPSAEADRRVVDEIADHLARHGVTRRLVEAVWAVERRRWTSRIEAPRSPEELRRLVFDRAAREGPRAARQAIAAELSLTPDALVAALFADRPAERRLVAPASLPTEVLLRERFNLALAEGFILRATEVVATVHGHAREVVVRAKLLGLMIEVVESGAELRVAISGPLALFHETVKYGRALVHWLPSLLVTPAWSLRCKVVLRGEPRCLELDGRAPLARTRELPAAFDSKLEARLDRDVRKLGRRLEREMRIVRAGSHLFFPDFTYVGATGGRIAVEVAGFWTPEYLAAKERLLAQATEPLLLCVDRRHADRRFEAGPRVLFFDRRVDARALVAACEALLAPPVRPRARHWLTLPDSAGLAAHATRLGAAPSTWRTEVAADLAATGALTIGLARDPVQRRTRALACGRRFAVEIVRDTTRPDAVFARRIVAPVPDLPTRRFEASLRLRAPNERVVSVDAIAPLLDDIVAFAGALATC